MKSTFVARGTALAPLLGTALGFVSLTGVGLIITAGQAVMAMS